MAGEILPKLKSLPIAWHTCSQWSRLTRMCVSPKLFENFAQSFYFFQHSVLPDVQNWVNFLGSWGALFCTICHTLSQWKREGKHTMRLTSNCYMVIKILIFFHHIDLYLCTKIHPITVSFKAAFNNSSDSTSKEAMQASCHEADREPNPPTISKIFFFLNFHLFSPSKEQTTSKSGFDPNKSFLMASIRPSIST